MGKWRELAEQLEAHDNSDVSANSPPIVPIVTNVTGLPAAIVEGLECLRTMAAPRVQSPVAWRLAVTDALSLAQDGWAARALSLGWCPLDLFGAVADPGGNADDDGLAAWLRGCRLSVISETFALVEADGGKFYFNRHDRGGTRLLWSFGQ